MVKWNILDIKFILLYGNSITTLAKDHREYKSIVLSCTLVLSWSSLNGMSAFYFIFNHLYKKYKQPSLSISCNNSERAAVQFQ